MRELFEERTRQKVQRAVDEIERRTSAEIVVAVEPISGFYRHADLLGGLVAAFVALAVFLYHPEPFDWSLLPLELAGAFALGAVFVGNVDGVRRALSSRALLSTNVRRAALAKFVDLGVSKKRDRNGILVFVSAFERRVEVVPDVGVEVASLGSAWGDGVQKLDRALRLDADAERFVAALRGLGAPLAEALPRADGGPTDDGAVDEGDDEEPRDADPEAES
jgi:putative membrane protein